jgi:hypothetical protein
MQITRWSDTQAASEGLQTGAGIYMVKIDAL